MHYAFLVDVKLILSAQTIKLVKIASISSTFVRRENLFTDSMQSLLSYVPAFEKDYGVCFVNVCIMYILKYTTSSKLIPSQLQRDRQ